MSPENNDSLQKRIEEWQKTYDGPAVVVTDLLCGRHTGGSPGLIYEDAIGREETYTYARLLDLSSRFAAVLKTLGVSRGDRVATLLPKSPALVVATLGLWRLGAAHVPLFTAFGPQAIGSRVNNSAAAVIVTDTANRGKLDETDLGDPKPKIISVAGDDSPPAAGDIDFQSALDSATAHESPVSVTGNDLLILIYTSGTTGSPKGVEVPVKALASFESYLRCGLDVRDDDVYWNMADPGWAYGLFYALAGPLLLGKPVIFLNAPFDVEGTYRFLERHQVTNATTAPTVFRMMRAAGSLPSDKPVLQLRLASCAGEPLNPDVVAWGKAHLGVSIHDHYGQTEGGMMVCNHHLPSLRRELRPGSMGQAMPGFRIVILDNDGAEVEPGQEGQIAVDTHHSPLFWFRGYYQDPKRTRERFTTSGRYYLTGDSASQDPDGYIAFSGRDDDIITSAGYRIGPFEPESALIAHEAVAEAAVIGVPDAVRGEIVKAFVVLKPDHKPSQELSEALRSFVQSNLSAHAYPREIAFIDQLPKTPSGKVQRFLLRDQPA